MSILDRHWNVIRGWTCTPEEFRSQSLDVIATTDFNVALIKESLLDVLSDIETKVLSQLPEFCLNPMLFQHMESIIRARTDLFPDEPQASNAVCVLFRLLLMHLMGTFLNTAGAARAANSGVDSETRHRCQEIIDGVEAETLDTGEPIPVSYAAVWAAQKIGICRSTSFPEQPRYSVEVLD